MVRKTVLTLPKLSRDNSPLGDISFFVGGVAFAHR